MSGETASPCPDCGGAGEWFGHADDCDSDTCALNGDVDSCNGQLVQCHCAAASAIESGGLTREAVINWIAADIDDRNSASFAAAGVPREEEPVQKFRRRMWDKIDKDTYDDEPIVLDFEEFGRLCSFMDSWLRSTVESPDEAEMHRMIHEAAELIKPAAGETVFTIRVRANDTVLHTRAATGVVPDEALRKAIEALRAERGDLGKCPAHNTTPAQS